MLVSKVEELVLGHIGLADVFARMCLRFDSDQAIDLVDRIFEKIKISAYHTSVELAKERGTFPIFNWELEKENLFIKLLPLNLQEEIKKYGRRNISLLTNAPTGSISCLSQTSSGIEPVFKNFYIRRRKLVEDEDEKIDFIDLSGDKWKNYKVFHQNVRDYLNKFSLNEDVELPSYFVESDKIDWLKRIKIQSTIQKHIDHRYKFYY